MKLLLWLAPHLTTEQAERALAAVAQMNRASHQARTVVELLPRLPSDRRPAAVQFALTVIGRYPFLTDLLGQVAPWLANDQQRTELYDMITRAGRKEAVPNLAWLAPHFLPEHRTAALGVVAGLADRCWMALSRILPQLDDAQLASATAALTGIADPGVRARGLAKLASLLPADWRQEVVMLALAAATDPAGADHSYYAWDDLLPLLDHDQLNDVLCAVSSLRDEDKRAHGLIKLTERLASEQLVAATSIASAISDPRSRATVLVALIPRLSDEHRQAAVAAAVAGLIAKPGFAWSQELADLAPYLTAEQLGELWDVALREEREYPQGGVAALMPWADGTRRTQALELILTYEPGHRIEALADLAPHLDAEQLKRAYQAALEVKKPEEQARTVAAIASYLPPEDTDQAWDVALSAATRLRDPSARAKLLTDLAPKLDADRRRTALAWAFAAAVTIPPEERGPGFEALTGLVSLLEE